MSTDTYIVATEGNFPMVDQKSKPNIYRDVAKLPYYAQG